MARRRDDLDAAQGHDQIALDAYRRFDMIDNQVISLTGLAGVHHRAGRFDESQHALASAADLCHRMGATDKAQRLLRGEID